MALAEAVITYDLSDLVGSDFNVGQTQVWVTTNVPGSAIVDSDGAQVRIGDGFGTLDADGTGSVSVWVPGDGSNPASWQTYINVSYSPRRDGWRPVQRTFGPFTVTEDTDLAYLIPEQEVPPTYLSQVTAELQTYVDAASDSADAAEQARLAAAALILSDLGTTDGQTRALIENPLSQTAVALGNGFVPQWKTGQNYDDETVLLGPGGEIVTTYYDGETSTDFYDDLDNGYLAPVSVSTVAGLAGNVSADSLAPALAPPLATALAPLIGPELTPDTLAARELSRVQTLPAAPDAPAITYSTSSTISGGVAVRERRVGGVAGADLDMSTDPAFRYVGFPSAQGWQAAPNFYTVTPLMPGGAAQARRWDFQAETVYDGAEIEFVLFSPSAGNAPYYFLIDGRRTSFTTPTSGLGVQDIYVKLTFPDARTRHIRVVTSGANPWQGARIQPGTTLVRPTTPVGKVVAVVGDSIQAGANDCDASETAAHTIAYALGADVAVNASIGGTKWVPSGSGDVANSHFGGGRLTALLSMGVNTIVFVGSRNDDGSSPASRTAIQNAVDTALAAVAAVPEVYVVGTITDLPQNSPVQTATLARSRPFIDVHDAITGNGTVTAPNGSGNADLYIDFDGVHPSYAGHRYLERLILRRLIALNVDTWRPDRYRDLNADKRARSGVGAIVSSAQLPDAPSFLQVDPKVGAGTATAFSMASVGNWAVLTNASCIGNGYVNNNTYALGDSLAYDFVLSAGTWRFDIMYVKDPGGAQTLVELQNLDGTWATLGTIEHYNASAAYNAIANFTGITVTGAARRRRLRLTVSGKNASSSAYAARFQFIQARRTDL